MFPSSFPFFDYHRGHHGHHGYGYCGGGIYNNLIVNAPYHHEWRQPYYYPQQMPIIYDINNITQNQGQAQGQSQRSS